MFLKFIFKIQSNEIEPDLAFTGASSSTTMKSSGLIPDFHHKDCTHYMSGLLEVLVSHATYVVISDIAVPDCPRHSSLKISPPEFILILTTPTPVLLSFMEYSLPS